MNQMTAIINWFILVLRRHASSYVLALKTRSSHLSSPAEYLTKRMAEGRNIASVWSWDTERGEERRTLDELVQNVHALVARGKDGAVELHAALDEDVVCRERDHHD